MRNNIKAMVGCVAGTLGTGLLVDNFAFIPSNLKILGYLAIAGNIILLIHSGRWVQLSWEASRRREI